MPSTHNKCVSMDFFWMRNIHRLLTYRASPLHAFSNGYLDVAEELRFHFDDKQNVML